MNLKFHIATAGSRQATQWRNRVVTWQQLVDKCTQTRRTHETVDEYRRMDKNRQSEIKDVGGFVGGFLRDGKRRKGNVEFRSLATLDIDYGRPDVWDEFTMQFNCAALLYSTHKHTPEAPRLRLVIPFSRRVTVEEYEPVCRKIAESIGIDMFDVTTYETPRLFYWPSTSADGEFVSESQNGEPLDPDEILALYHDWRDASEWPVAEREGEVIRREIRKMEDPTEKGGIIGAFCRTYSIEEAIDKFLRDVYEPTAQEGRYTYREGSVAGGLVCYDGKWAYSHHETDPAGKQSLNAFDLVRIHKFGSLDEGKRQEDITKLPSYSRMAEFASEDGETRRTAVRERVSEAEKDFGGIDLSGDEEDNESEECDEWMSLLEMTKKGEPTNTLSNAMVILENDPKLKGKIRFDEFYGNISVTGSLPWRKEPGRWKNADNSQLRIYLDRKYKITGKDKVADAKTACADNHRFHPVRDYLNALEWDGQKRVRTLLIDYLGAEDCMLNRRVMELWMAGAVSRVMFPGCKFDYTLILQGPQGVGKSTLLEVLGGEWYNGSVSATEPGKSSYEQLQGAWIVELQELDSMRRSESSAVKAFLSSPNDNFRGAYKEDSEDHPRQCVFAGTTNESMFLKDKTGDRRFWIVEVDKAREGFTRDRLIRERDQIWAEARQLIRQFPKGEDGRPKIMLSREEDEEMKVRQLGVSYNSLDQTESSIRRFLEIKLPEDWVVYTVAQRRLYYQNEDDIIAKGKIERERMCIVEFVNEFLRVDTTDSQYNTVAKNVKEAMQKIEGWRNVGRQKCKYGGNYGVQRNVYDKVVDDSDDDDI